MSLLSRRSATSLVIGLLLLLTAPVSASGTELVELWATPLSALDGADLRGLVRIDDLLLLEDVDTGLTALSLASGVPRWFVRLEAPLDYPPTGGKDLIVTSAAGRLLVVTAAGGKRVLQRSVVDVHAAAPVQVGSALVLASHLHDTLVVHDQESGVRAWSVRLPAGFIGALRTTPGDQVVLACADGSVRAFRADPAQPAGEVWVARPGLLLDTVVTDDDGVFLTTLAPLVTRLHAASGQTVWAHRPESVPRAAPVVQDGVVVVTTDAGLLALDAGSGEPLWSVPADERPVGIADGVLVSRSADHKTVLRDARSGALLLEGLSPRLLPCGDVLVEWGDDQVLRALRVHAGS